MSISGSNPLGDRCAFRTAVTSKAKLQIVDGCHDLDSLRRALRLFDDDHRQRRHDWLQLESELFLEGD